MYIHQTSNEMMSFTFSEINGCYHFSFKTDGGIVDLSWYDDVVLKNEQERYALLVFKNGKVLLATSNGKPETPETICNQVFLSEFKQNFDVPEGIEDALPRCVKCIHGLKSTSDGGTGYTVTDKGGSPLFEVDDQDITLSKVTKQRVLSKLDPGVTMDLTFLHQQLKDLIVGQID